MRTLRDQFESQRRQILANLDTTRIGKSYTKKSWLDDLMNWETADEQMKQAMSGVLHSLIIETGRNSMIEVGQQPSMFDPISEAITRYNDQRSTKIAKDVNDETEKQLRAALSRGVSDGMSSAELRAVVESIMGSASTMRADRIARTETTRAQGFGDLEAWKQSGVVESKEWFTAEDEHVCPFCDQMDGKTIGLEETFFDKGDVMQAGDQKLDLSYDDIASAPLHVNCRCTLLPVRK